MSAKTKSSSTPSIRDPSTNLHRPTSAKTPDVAHILTSVFGELFTKDVLTTDVIKNLTVSSDVDDENHKSYVNKLKEAQIIKETRLQEYSMLEKHILEAKARALALEDRENIRRNQTCSDPDLYGVPPVKAYFSYCLDDALLREHGLLVPSDYYFKPKVPTLPSTPKPDEKQRTYLQETASSRVRTKLQNKNNVLPPIKTNSQLNKQPGIDEIDELHKSGSEMSDEDLIQLIRNEIDENEEEEDEEVDENGEKPFWKHTLRQEERVNDRLKLKKLNERTNFLPNPRHFAARMAPLNNNPELIFEVTPKVLRFDRYYIGKVFETSFEVRNMSSIAHQFRAIPPKTQYFSLSLGQYPQGQSVIAPGLSALFNVRFAPDSLGSFEDEICIETSNGSKIIVDLVAKRESPCLSIGPVLDCGHALVGQIKGCRFIVENLGGDGRFVIFSKQAWPTTSFKTNLVSSSLNLHPFEIQPSVFELRKGDAFVLECIFKPPDDKAYEQDVVIVCDNCTTMEFKLTGKGELARVELLEASNDSNLQATNSEEENFVASDDFKDVSSSRIIRFTHLNPNVFERRNFSIRNNSSCPIDFSWANFKPILEDNLLSERNSLESNYAPDPSSLFSIAPKHGTLDRDEVKNFEVLFAPNKVGYFTTVAHLILHGIPEINKQLMLDTKNELVRRNYLLREDFNTTDFVATVIEMRGECEPYQFALDPPAIFIPGEIYMQSTSRKSFRLINMSPNPINFRWKQTLEPHIIQVEPSYGEISPKSYALMDVLVTGTRPGSLNEDVACYVEFAEEPVFLHVEAQIKGPEAIVREAGIDFGLVKLGDSARTFFTLENISNLPLNWSLKSVEYQNLFDFEPNGSLLPLETRQIYIRFKPNEELILSTQFEISIEMGKPIVFNCYGQAQRPVASFLQSEIILDNLFLNIEQEFTFQLFNHSMLKADFVWGKPQGADSSTCELEFDYETKNGGTIEKKSTFEGTIRIKSVKLGPIEDLRIPCFIKDMSHPIFLSIRGLVKGVSIDFYVLDKTNKDKSTVVDFGRMKCSDNTSGEKLLIVSNTSAIATRVRLRVERFGLLHEDDKITMKKKSNTAKVTDRFRLSDYSNGVGFGFSEEELELSPFGESSCALYAIGELWGEYEDTLIMAVDGVPFEHRLPIFCRVEGAPLRLYTGRVRDDDEEAIDPVEVPVVRFGNLVQANNSNAAECQVRKLQIQNTCRVPIEIDWRVFLTEPDDNKLIDLNLIYPDIDEESLSSSTSSREDDVSAFERRQSNTRNQSSAFIKEKIEPIMEEEEPTMVEEEDDENELLNQVRYFPIVRVNLGTHYGREIKCDDEEKVFFLNEYKSTLKPREKTALSITFNSNVKICRSFEATFIGYLKLAQNFIEGDGFKRKIGFDYEPIRFKATGTLESPNLTVEFANDDLTFRSAIGDLIKPTEFKNWENFISYEKIYKNRFALLNNTLAPIEFTLTINKPFSISNPSPKYLIKPKSKQKFDVLFKLNADLIRKQNFNEQKQALIHDYITINYTNNTCQHISIDAKIFAPEIRISPSSMAIDYETCLIGQERCQQVILKNPSFSSIVWTLNIENDPESVFRCDLTRGILEADKDFINKNEQIVNVFFTAQSNQEYKSKLVIRTKPSINVYDESICIDLHGIGSLDQKHEAVLDI